MLLDLLSPTVDCTAQKRAFISIALGRKFCKVVVAQSSSFRLFTTLVAEEASACVECLIRAEFIKLKPFSEDLARKFLSSLGTQVNVEEMVQYCKGIPKLLSLCGKESYKAGINAVQLHEFYTVLRFAEKYHQRVNWKNEMNLVAAKFGLNITHVGLSRGVAENLFLFVIPCQHGWRGLPHSILSEERK